MFTTINTSIGIFSFQPSRIDTINVWCGNNAIVRGIEYRVTLIGRLIDNEWKIDERSDWMRIRRCDKPFLKSAPSDSARKTILSEAASALKEYVANNQQEINKAHAECLSEQCQIAARKTQDLERELEQAKKELETARIVYSDFVKATSPNA